VTLYHTQCIPDPNNPRGPCISCQEKVVRMSRLPCLRYLITDVTLFRTGLDFIPFYRDHPMVGDSYGDFHLSKQWTRTQPRMLSVGQLQGGMNFQVEVHEFFPPANNRDLDSRKRPMYAVPWAIRDQEAAVASINDYINDNFARYFYETLDNTDPQIRDVFNAAHRTSVFPVPVSIGSFMTWSGEARLLHPTRGAPAL
jgi:hypothetical protein